MNVRVLAAINDQINSEFQASYTYLAMAGFCDRQKYLGAANGCVCKARRSGSTP
jgi:ferritin